MPSEVIECDDERKQFITTAVRTLLGGHSSSTSKRRKSATMVDNEVGISEHVKRFLDDPR